MRYSQEFIDEVVQSYLRTDNISYVSRKYKVSIITVRKWIDQYEKNKENEKYAKKLAKMSEVINFYDKVKDYKLTAQEFGISLNRIEKVIKDYRAELHFKTSDFKKLEKDLKKLLAQFTKTYEVGANPLVLEKLIQIELCLGQSDDYIIEKYNPNVEMLLRVKKMTSL